MRQRIVSLAAGLLLAAVLAGCGGGSSRPGGMMDGTGGMMGGGPTATAGTGTTGNGGRALFVANCGGCHTLAAVGTSGAAGPNLDQARPSYGEVLELVTNGAGAMPSFAGTLTRAQIQAIARYVGNATGAPGSGQ